MWIISLHLLPIKKIISVSNGSWRNKNKILPCSSSFFFFWSILSYLGRQTTATILRGDYMDLWRAALYRAGKASWFQLRLLEEPCHRTALGGLFHLSLLQSLGWWMNTAYLYQLNNQCRNNNNEAYYLLSISYWQVLYIHFSFNPHNPKKLSSHLHLPNLLDHSVLSLPFQLLMYAHGSSVTRIYLCTSAPISSPARVPRDSWIFSQNLFILVVLAVVNVSL